MVIHIRKFKPKRVFKNHRTYKKFLRPEFSYACVYCNCREPEKGCYRSFHVDHYEPKSRFKNAPLKANEYENLFYSCPDCNGNKLDYWPTRWLKLLNMYIINPCKQDPDKEIDKSNSDWKGKSDLGRWNITKLGLSSPRNIEIRDDRKVLLGLIANLKIELTQLQAKDPSGTNPRIQACKAEIRAFENKVVNPC